jgi:hypothetical protein
MIEVQLVDGRIIEFPDGTSQDVIRETAKKATNNKYFGVSTEELKKQPTAPFSVSDTAKAGLASLVGSAGSIASAFGADTAPAKYLRETASGIQQTLSPERQEEMRRRAELEDRASKQGIGQEIMTGLSGVAEAPLQSTVSGIASSAPTIIAGSALLSFGAPVAIAGAVALTIKLAVGALQGAGEAKGNIYETVRDKLMAEKGMSREEAEAQASKAQEYISANAPAIMGSAAAGMLDAVTGPVEDMFGKKFAAKAATRPLTAPSLTGTILKGAGQEALPEAIQGGIGKYGENVALQNAGFDVSSFSGVTGAAARDALMGALTGAAVSPLQISQLRKEFEEDKQRRLNDEKAKIDEQVAKEQEAIQQQEAAKEQEILNTPVERVKEPENIHPIRNPLGNISREELQAEGIDPYLVEHIDEYRKVSNLPPLKSYSIEDISDAMTGSNPAEEQKQIDTILNARTGYQGEPISAKDVLDQAAAREIPTDNKAFTDFLNRTTGVDSLRNMSNSQLFAAFQAVQNIPQGQELEEGTSATRFTPQQYKEAIKSLDKELETAALPVDQVLSNIKLTTGLNEDLHAASILNEAVRRGDVDREGNNISAPTTSEKLPEGYDIQEGTFKQGEKPEGYEVVFGEKALPQLHATEEAAQKKADEITKVRGNMFKQLTNQISQQEKALQKSEEGLTAMQAAGQQNTVPYQKAWAKHQKLDQATNANIQKLNLQLEHINPDSIPVSIRKAAARVTQKRGHTLFKGQKAISTHKTRQEAEAKIVEGMTDEELVKISQAKGRRTLATQAKKEMERRAAPPPVQEVDPGKEFETKFKPLLDKFGLNNVALKFIKDMKSEGEYSRSIIKVALDSANPVRVLRHESVHALKELGFFTPEQWKTLEGKAKKEWINTYLKGRNINGDPLEAGQQSRYDAYMNVYKGDMDAIIEEAIADAFGDFDVNKAPPGLMSAILKRLKLFFEALQNALIGAGFQTYEDVFGKVEKGELKATQEPTAAEVKYDYRATPEEVKQAEKYYAENGIMPYLSEGQLDIPVQIETKFSLKTVSKYDKYDDVTGLPLNKNGTVTLYYHTTRDRAQESVANKKITNDTGKNRVYLTNESSGWKTLEDKGALPQETDGTVIMVNVDPKLLNMLEEYKDGRKDFFIPTKQGAAFIRKMQLFSIVKDRKEAISNKVTLNDIGNGITTGLSDYLALTPKERKDRFKEAKNVLREEHNVANLLGENGKLEKTRIGDYGLTYDGKSINSRGLGLASAQKINEKLSTCPNSAICEDLCLGETSGNNLVYGGAAGESYSGNIARSAFKAGPRMSQYLKTEALVLHPQEFAIALHEQIQAFVRKCEKDGYQPAIRLNVTSDFAPKVFEAIIKANPDVVFYDYTKLGSETIAPNHHLTYSSTGVSQVVNGKKIVNKQSNWAAMRKRLDNGQNVAMAFTTKEVMPQYIFDEETGTTYQVWDGDNYDARFLDPKSEDGMGMIVGLSNKAATLKEVSAAQETDGFFVYYDPKVDGDTVTIKNQNKIAGKIPIKAEPTKKLSLRDTELDLETLLAEYSRPAKSIDDADRALGKGDRVFIMHEMADDVTEISSASQLKGYTADQVVIVPANINFSPDIRYSLRDTPEFKEWFGDSKVVDEYDRPLVVYHGTPSFEGNVFKPTKAINRSGNIAGFYFSKRKEDVNRYAKHYKNEEYPEGAQIIPAYLSIQNPFYERKSPITQAMVDQYKKELIDLNQHMSDEKLEQWANSKLPGLKENGYPSASALNHDGDAYQRIIKAGGYDGYTSDNIHWVAFDSEQIKSSVGNIGTFDKTNPDIRYSLRDTPQFKNWFGDSKIVNADGTPKVMYHGTAQDISEFKPKQANAIFVTDNPKFAESFTLNSENFMAQKVLDSLSLEDRQQITKQAEKIAKKKGTFAGDEVRGVLMERLPSRANIIPVYVSAQNPFDYDNKKHINALEEYEKENRYTDRSISNDIGYIKLGSWESIERLKVQQAIKSFGFDGFYVKEGGQKNLAVYKPEQIKSATGNVGTFDKYNPDIRYDLRNSTDPFIMASVDRVTTAREEKGFVERMMEAISPKSWSDFRAEALNRYNRLGEYDKKLAEKMGGAALYADVSAESAALFSDLGAGLTASALGVHDRNGGIPVFKNGVTTVSNLNGTVKGPVAIFAPLAKYNDPTIYQLYQFWAGAKRGKRLLADGREETYTPAMLSYAKKLEQTHPEFVQIQKDWIQFNNGLVQFLVDTGVLSKEKADEFTRYSDYVPFYRQMDGENTIGPNIFQAISGVKAPKKLKGSEAPLADFLETVVRNTQSSIQMGIKNVASQRAANVATKINMAERLNHVASGVDVFVVMENGKQVYYRSADYLFINAIKSLNLPDLPFIGLLSAPANLLRNLVTKDPGFMLANMVRDSMAAYLTSGAKMTPIASTVANFGKAIAGTSPEFNALLNAGLLGGYEFSSNVEQSGKTMQEALRIKAGMKTNMDKAKGVWQLLEKGTTASDAATRMEIYKSTMAETGNEAEALFRAMEVMNFNRKGSSAVVRLLTAAVPFLNARMQGLDVLYRTAFGQNATANAKEMKRAFFVRGMTMFGMSCMYWALTHDDDDYKKQEQETKDNYWLIPALGIKIPTPFEVAIPFKVIPERIMALAFGTDTAKDFTESMTRQLVNTLAFNPIPQTALPFVEVVTNHSFFTGRDIIGQGMQDIAPEFQIGPNTSLAAQKIGSALGMSPMKIDHIIKGFTGTMGMYAVDVIDGVLDLNNNSPKVSKRFEQYPIIKRFAIDPEARGAVTAYYDLKNSVDETTRTINLLERTGNFEAMGEYYKDNMNLLATKDYVSDLEKDMKQIREMKVMVRSSSMSGDEKRDALVSLNRMENQLTANIQDIRKFALK